MFRFSPPKKTIYFAFPKKNRRLKGETIAEIAGKNLNPPKIPKPQVQQQPPNRKKFARISSTINLGKLHANSYKVGPLRSL